MGAAALPANAQTYQDTALSATAVSSATFGGSNLTATNGTKVITLAGTNVTWSLHGTVPSGVSLSGATISNYGHRDPARPASWPTLRMAPGTPKRS